MRTLWNAKRDAWLVLIGALLLPTAALADCLPVSPASGDTVVCTGNINPPPYSVNNLGSLTVDITAGTNFNTSFSADTIGSLTMTSAGNLQALTLTNIGTLALTFSGGNTNGALSISGGTIEIVNRAVNLNILTVDAAISASLDNYAILNGGISLTGSGDAHITNRPGAIINGVGGTSPAASIYATGSGDVTIDMLGGTLNAGIVTASGADTLNMQAGTVNGTVSLGAGNDTANVSGGRIQGPFLGGDDEDGLFWSGGAIQSVDMGDGDDLAQLIHLPTSDLGGTVVSGGLGDDSLTFIGTSADRPQRFTLWEDVALTEGSTLTMGGQNLTLGDAGTLSGALSIDATSTLSAGGGNSSILPFTGGNAVDVTNAGLIDLADPGQRTADSLTIAGDYHGQNGTLRLDTVLAGDGAPSDRLVIDGGGADGSTGLLIHNVGGSGAQTQGDGILVVEAINGGATDAGAFHLAAEVAAGPYLYSLYRGGGSSADNWYLRNTIDCATDPNHVECEVTEPEPEPEPGPEGPGGGGTTPPTDPTPPQLRPETSLTAAIPGFAMLLGDATLDTLHERMGDVRHDHPGAGTAGNGDAPVWGRVIAEGGSRSGDAFGVLGARGPTVAGYQIGALQLGLDLYGGPDGHGNLDRAGLYGVYGRGVGTVVHFDDEVAGVSGVGAMLGLGGYWTRYIDNGPYIDAIGQIGLYQATADSTGGYTLDTPGVGIAASLEGGVPLHLGDWVVEPQIQANYQSVAFRPGMMDATEIVFSDVDSLTGRAGLRIARDFTMDTGAERIPVTAWLRGSLVNEFLNRATTSFGVEGDAYVPFTVDLSGPALNLTAGLDLAVSDRLSLHGNVGYQQALTARAQSISAKLGFRMNW